MNENEKRTFVFLGSWVDILDGVRKQLGEDAFLETLKEIYLYGTNQPSETENPLITGIVKGSCAPLIDKAKVRYKGSEDGGEKGHRRKKELDKEEVYQKKKELKTWGKVAQYFGIDEKTLRTRRTEWEEEESFMSRHESDEYISPNIDELLDKDRAADGSLGF